MIKIEVENVVCSDLDGKEYIYSYFLTKKRDIIELDKKADIYGIEVVSTNKDTNYYEKTSTLDFTTSKEYALETIKYLADNMVSPIHFLDVLSDKLDKNYN